MKKIRIIVITALVISLLATTAVFAASSGYDSTLDPVVSLSYLNDVFLPSITSAIDELRAQIENLKTGETAKPADTTTPATPATSDGNAYVVLEMKRGQTLYAPTAALELILRAGKAIVVSPFVGADAQGLSDMTGGADIQNGTVVAANHLLLIPRAGDGRGITITSDIAYVMVRGSYEIVD